MSTTLLRSLIVGSISAAALLITTAPPATAAEGDDLPPFEMAPVCHTLDPANLDVRGTRDRSENWQWSFSIRGNTSKICNGPIVTELTNLNTGASTTQEFTVFDIVAANGRGEDYVSSFTTQCDYRSSVYLTSERVLFVDTGDVHRPAFTCAPPDIAIPEDVVIPNVPATPTPPTVPAGPTTTTAPTTTADTSDTTDAPDTTDTTLDTADADPDATGTPRTDVPGGESPSGDEDHTLLLVAGALLVGGAGLAFTAIALSRRRQGT